MPRKVVDNLIKDEDLKSIKKELTDNINLKPISRDAAAAVTVEPLTSPDHSILLIIMVEMNCVNCGANSSVVHCWGSCVKDVHALCRINKESDVKYG